VIGAAIVACAPVPAIAQEAPKGATQTDAEALKPLTFVDEDGAFQRQFNALNTVLEKSRGNEKNAILGKIAELVYLNSRCDPAKPVTYSMTRLEWAGIAQPYQAYQDWLTANSGGDGDDSARALRERALIDEINSKLAATWFPRKRDCDAIPILLSIGQYDTLLLEESDAGNPLVGEKVNDGLLFSALTENNPIAEAFAARNTGINFAQMFAVNRFSNAQDALNAAFMYGSGNKLVIFDGKNSSVYRMGDFRVDITLSGPAFDAQFDALKAAKLRDGITILAAVSGDGRGVRINEPGK